MNRQDWQVLVVEDSPKIANLVQTALRAEEFSVLSADNGQKALGFLEHEHIDLLVLDLGLPDMDGLDVLRTLRERESRTPVLILSARETVEEKVQGLDIGADDYLVKPFAVPELLARVRSLLRRRAAEEYILTCGDLVLNMEIRSVARGSEEIFLAPKEMLLLEYFLKHKGEVISRAMLAVDVWKYDKRTVSLDNMIDVQISRLREKIDRPYSTKLLHTVRGVGFILKESG